jgi:hypothetical protein
VHAARAHRDLVGLLPAGRPLAFATAVVIDGLLQVSARTVDDRRAERPEAAGKSAEADENADRLRFWQRSARR